MASLIDYLRAHSKQVKHLGLPNYRNQVVIPKGTLEYVAPSDGTAYIGYLVPANSSVSIQVVDSGDYIVLVGHSQQNVIGNTWWYSRSFRMSKGQKFNVKVFPGSAGAPETTDVRFYPDFG